MRLRSKSISVLAAVTACLAVPVAAHAAFVPALGSPFPTGATTQAIAVGDADRNATVDVVAGGLSLLRANAAGRLGGPIPIGTPGAVVALAGGDLNGDTLRDYAAIAPGSPRRLLVFSGSLTGSYGASEVLADAGPASDVAIANVNGDGLADLIVTRAESGANVTVLRNLGGIFLEDSYAAGLSAAGDVAAGDLNGDGAPDLVVGGADAEVATLVNQGDGTFTPHVAQPAAAAGAAEHVALLHLDGDGRLDAVASDSGGTSSVLALRGNGFGDLVAAGRWPTGLPSPPTAIAVGDVNGDGTSDVVAGAASGRMALLLGQGSARLAPGSPFANHEPAVGAVDDVVVADMNFDGQPDVVTANRPGTVSVQLNSSTGLLQPLPSALDFGAMPARALARSATITLRSMRGRLRITRVEVQGSRAYAVASRGCVGRTLLLGQSCSMGVTFTPTRKAKRQEALLSVDANAAAIVVPLTATPRPPVVSRLRLRPRSVAPGGRLKLRYRLSEAARVRALVQLALPGRRVAGECVTPSARNATRRRCTRWVSLAKATGRGEAAAANVLRLRARAAGRKLAPGRYRLSVSASDRYRNRSDERFVRFLIQRAF